MFPSSNLGGAMDLLEKKADMPLIQMWRADCRCGLYKLVKAKTEREACDKLLKADWMLELDFGLTDCPKCVIDKAKQVEEIKRSQEYSREEWWTISEEAPND
jgi:hypothetical protein